MDRAGNCLGFVVEFDLDDGSDKLDAPRRFAVHQSDVAATLPACRRLEMARPLGNVRLGRSVIEDLIQVVRLFRNEHAANDPALHVDVGVLNGEREKFNVHSAALAFPTGRTVQRHEGCAGACSWPDWKALPMSIGPCAALPWQIGHPS